MTKISEACYWDQVHGIEGLDGFHDCSTEQYWQEREEISQPFPYGHLIDDQYQNKLAVGGSKGQNEMQTTAWLGGKFLRLWQNNDDKASVECAYSDPFQSGSFGCETIPDKSITVYSDFFEE